MEILLKTFAQILLHRQGPEHLPDSTWLLRATLAAYCLVGFVAMLVSGIFRSNPGAALMEVAVDVVFLCLWCWGLLSFAGFRHRLRQTLTAALGCGALLGLLFLPVFALTLNAQPADPNLPATTGQLMAALLYVALLVWTASVIGHITARALNLGYVTGLGLGVLFVVTELVLITALFPIEV